MGGKKGGEGMCTVQKDYMQGRKKRGKGNAEDSQNGNDPLDGKVLDSSGKKILDRGTFKEFKICMHCNQVMVWRKAWERSWNDVKYCSDKCRAEGKRAAKGEGGGHGGVGGVAAAENEVEGGAAKARAARDAPSARGGGGGGGRGGGSADGGLPRHGAADGADFAETDAAN